MTDKTITINGKDYYTYATVEESNEYFGGTYGSEWENVSDVQKEKLLITATRVIDRADYQGEKVDKNQPLKFPRIISGEKTSEEILMSACCELAANIYSDGGTDSSIMNNIKSVSLGDSSVSFVENGKTECEDDLILERYLSDYLLGGVQVIL